LRDQLVVEFLVVIEQHVVSHTVQPRLPAAADDWGTRARAQL